MFSKLSSLGSENTRDRKWIRRSLQVLFHQVCLFVIPCRSVMLVCCCLCCERSTLRSGLVPRQKLLWSSVTLGSSDDAGYGGVRFIAQARLASARTQHRAQTHKHIPTKRDPRGCLLGHPRLWGFRVDPRPSIAHWGSANLGRSVYSRRRRCAVEEVYRMSWT